MAKIKVVENKVFIKSEVTMENLLLVSEVKPAALELTTGEGADKKIEFKVEVGYGDSGSLGKYGAVFATIGSNNMPVIVDSIFTVDSSEESREVLLKELKERYGIPLLKLNKVEAQVKEALTEVNAQYEQAAASMEIVEI